MQIGFNLLMMAPTEYRKFDRKMADFEKNAEQDENIDTHRRESPFEDQIKSCLAELVI